MLFPIVPVLLLLAEPPSPADHRVRVHGEMSLLRGEMRFYNDRPSLSFTPSDAKAGQVQFLRPSLSLGVGAAPTPWLVLGARFTGAVESQYQYVGYLDDAPGEWYRRSTLELGVLPYVEARLLPDRRVQPFLLVEGGAAFARERQRIGDDRLQVRSLSGLVGGRVGLHAFVLPRLSVDADVGVLHAWDYALVRGHDNFLAAKRLRVAATIGVSGWF